MRVGVVSADGIHDFGHGLVGHELKSSKGDCHAQCGRVRDVEGGEAFGAKYVSGAMGNALVDGAVQLHTLLDD